LARRILLADDSVTAQNMGRRILTDAGYELVTVNNGSAALKKIAELKPDIVVLDVYMPGYGGLEVCQRIKESPDTARIPVLLTVGKLEPFKPDEARRVGADAFIVKPFEATELLTALTKLEDKIVAAPQPQKSGRFAKALAAVEQSDTGDRFGNKETGWKNRLIIPGPNAKTKAPEEAPEIAAVPTRGFERPEGVKPEEPSREFERPIPAGLPADITPEEIAAITAAAASFDGKAAHPVVIPEGSASDSAASMQAASAEVASVATSEPEVPATLASIAEAQAEPAGEPATPVEVAVEETSAAPVEVVSEVAVEATTEAVPVAPEVVAEAVANDEAPKAEEPVAPQESPAAVAEDQTGPPAAAQAPTSETQPLRNDDDVIAAIASLAPTSALGSENVSMASTGNGSGHGIPVATAGAEITGPRWIAEAVAVTAEESALVLEQEMERASKVTAVGEAVSIDQAPASVAETPAPVAETVEQNIEAVARVAEPAVESVATESAPPPTISESNTVEAIGQNIEPAAVKEESAYAAAAAAGTGAEHTASVEAISQNAVSPDVQEAAAVASVEAASQEVTPQREAELAAAWQNWKQIRESIVSGQPPASVAEAPATEARPVQQEETETADEDADNEDAEVETASSEAPGESTAIASIVDSMLAELRPKLVEEIAKKMNSEKKQKDKEKEKKKKR
jgi:twitching motility two-component system response regulator PilH